jgi:membrane-associated protease RseP (regulator of RpoE activity)
LHRLQEAQNDTATTPKSAATCGKCCSSFDGKSRNRSSSATSPVDRGGGKDSIEHAPQQIGWVVLPLSLDAVSPQTYLMLPAMVQFSQVLRALKRAHNLMDDSDEVPPNAPYRDPPSFPSALFRGQTNFERRLQRKSRRPASTKDSPETITDTSSSDSESENQVEDFAETVPPLTLPVTSLRSPQDHERPVLEGLSWHERDDEITGVHGSSKVAPSPEHSPSTISHMAGDSIVCTLKRGLPLGLALTKSPADRSFVVASVANESAADLAGLLPGDLILGINGSPSGEWLADLPTADAVIAAISELFTGTRTEKINVPTKVKPGAVLHVQVPPRNAVLGKLALGIDSTTDAKSIAKKTASECVKVRVPTGAKPGDTIEYKVNNKNFCEGCDLNLLIERSPSQCPSPAAANPLLEPKVAPATASQNPLLADSFSPDVPKPSPTPPSPSISAMLPKEAPPSKFTSPLSVPKKPLLDVIQVQLSSSHGTAKVGLRLCDRKPSKGGGKRQLHVVAVRSGSLAHRAGLRPQDQLVELNGAKCAQWSTTKAAKVLCRALSATATSHRRPLLTNSKSVDGNVGSGCDFEKRGTTVNLTVHRDSGSSSDLSSSSDNEWLDQVHRQWPSADDSTSRNNLDELAALSVEPTFVTPKGLSRSAPLSSADSLSSTSTSPSLSTTSPSSSASESSSDYSPSTMPTSRNRAHSPAGNQTKSPLELLLTNLKAGLPLCPIDGGDAHILRYVEDEEGNGEAGGDTLAGHRKRGGYFVWRAEEQNPTDAVRGEKKWQQCFGQSRRKKRSATSSCPAGAQFFCADTLESTTADRARDNHLGQRVVNGRNVTLVFAVPPSCDVASARGVADADSEAAQQVVKSMVAFKARRDLSEQQLHDSSASPRVAGAASTKEVTLPRYGPWMHAAYQRGRYELKVVCRSVEESDQLVRGLSAFAAQTLPTITPPGQPVKEVSPTRLPLDAVSTRNGDEPVALDAISSTNEDEDATHLTWESASTTVDAPLNPCNPEADVLTTDRMCSSSSDVYGAVSGEVATALRDAALAAAEAAVLSEKIEATIEGHRQHFSFSTEGSAARDNEVFSPTSRAAELSELFESVFRSGAGTYGGENVGGSSSSSSQFIETEAQPTEADSTPAGPNVSTSLINHFDSFSDPSTHIENSSMPRRNIDGLPGEPNTATKSNTRAVDASLDRPASQSTPLSPTGSCRPPLQETTSKVVNKDKGFSKKRAPETVKQTGTTTPTKKSPTKGTPRGTPRDMSPMRARAMRTKPSTTAQKPKASPPRWR